MHILYLTRFSHSSKVMMAFVGGGNTMDIFTGGVVSDSNIEGFTVVETWRDKVDGADLVIADNPEDYFKLQMADSGKPLLYSESGVGRSQLLKKQRVLAPWLVDLIGYETEIKVEQPRKRRWWRRNA